MLSVGRYTNRLHVRAACLDAILEGTMVTSDVVARKAFDAGQGALVLLTMAPSAMMALSAFVATLLADVDRRRLFLGAGIFGRLAMLLVFFALPPDLLPLFIIAILMNAISQTVLIPAQNSIYHANYSHSSRGRLFSRAATVGAVLAASAAFAGGSVLDSHPQAYRVLYPCAGLVAFGSCLIYGRLRLRRRRWKVAAQVPAGSGATGQMGWAARAWDLLSRHRQFRDFEIAFFIYGLGFMMLQPVFARFFVDELGLGYKEAAALKGVAFYVAYILSLPLGGRLLDRVGIPWLSVGCFMTLGLFAGSLAVAHAYPVLLCCFALYGMSMAGVSLAWNLGPPYFARERDSSRYMSLHVSLVGLRAMLGYPLGGAIAYLWGPRATFAAAAALFLLAVVPMVRVALAERR